MSTVTKTTKPARKPAARRTAAITPPPSKTFFPGYARAVLKVKDGVDLTKPTLAPGKYL